MVHEHDVECCRARPKLRLQPSPLHAVRRNTIGFMLVAVDGEKIGGAPAEAVVPAVARKPGEECLVRLDIVRAPVALAPIMVPQRWKKAVSLALAVGVAVHPLIPAPMILL